MRNTLLFLFIILLSACQSAGPDLTEFSAATQDRLKGLALSKQAANEFTLLYPKGAYNAEQLQAATQSLNNAWLKHRNMLQLPDKTPPLTAVLLPDAAQIQKVTGQNSPGANYPEDLLLALQYNDEQQLLSKRELFYLLTKLHWGNPGTALVAAGGGLFAEGECLDYDFPIEQLCAALHQSGQGFPWQELITDFAACRAKDEWAATVQAAFLFQFVYDNFSLGKVRDLWKSQQGFQNTETILGLSFSELEIYIVSRLDQINLLKPVDWTEVRQKGCW